ncbi:hypothetical protein [Vulcanisaeta sp. JCM 16159]|uniref:hypothetical protein n=1 Tax=Vulcanisaeta sp. JCM 16159 TaxID=1295371 RepID=UPI0006D18903|nr:hypothetical protein [Vulcanisaeta sp. JCM 16159]
MIKHELRKYITYGQLIMWPRLVINMKNHIKILLTVSTTGKDEVRNIRCSSIELMKRGSPLS